MQRLSHMAHQDFEHMTKSIILILGQGQCCLTASATPSSLHKCISTGHHQHNHARTCISPESTSGELPRKIRKSCEGLAGRSLDSTTAETKKLKSQHPPPDTVIRLQPLPFGQSTCYALPHAAYARDTRAMNSRRRLQCISCQVATKPGSFPLGR